MQDNDITFNGFCKEKKSERLMKRLI